MSDDKTISLIKTILLEGDEATARLAQDVAMVAEAGWVIRLAGDLGAGKTSFARAFIRTLAGDPGLEVPSPTYTLVQRYDEAEPAVLHADLYRLTDPDEMIELGLDDPEGPAIRLIEWPDHAGPDAFPGALTLTLSVVKGGAARMAEFAGPEALLQRLARTLAIRQFLVTAGHGKGERSRLQGDASSRRYERLRGPSTGHPLIVMDSPALPAGPIIRDGKTYIQLVHTATSVHAYVAIADALRQRGFTTPTIQAQDLQSGLLLIEDMGRDCILLPDGSPDPKRYGAAAELLAHLPAEQWPAELPVGDGSTHHLHAYDSDVFLTEITLLPDWYLSHRRIDTAAFDRQAFLATWRACLKPLEAQPATLTLRDVHSPNLIWRAGQEGLKRLALLDFQDALLGPAAYDVAALVQDARVTVPPPLQEALLERYCAARLALDPTFDRVMFTDAFALMAAQRASKILGIFARLNVRDGKPGYLKHLPRIETYLRQLLDRHAVLAPLTPFYDQLLPQADA